MTIHHILIQAQEWENKANLERLRGNDQTCGKCIDKAIDYYEQCALRIPVGRPDERARRFLKVADLYMQRNKIDKAKEVAKKGLSRKVSKNLKDEIKDILKLEI